MIHPQERLIGAIARLILDPAAPPARHIAVGAASPIPAAACWLVKKLGHDVRLSLLHKRTATRSPRVPRELFDLAGQGRLDLFFLGGGQIDGQANINLIGTGDWPGHDDPLPRQLRQSAFMYMTVPRTILFREEHSRRVLVERVDVISAPGVSPPEHRSAAAPPKPSSPAAACSASTVPASHWPPATPARPLPASAPKPASIIDELDAPETPGPDRSGADFIARRRPCRDGRDLSRNSVPGCGRKMTSSFR